MKLDKKSSFVLVFCSAAIAACATTAAENAGEIDRPRAPEADGNATPDASTGANDDAGEDFDPDDMLKDKDETPEGVDPIAPTSGPVADGETLPARASVQDTDTPVKSQGSRGTCSAFATSAGIENFVQRHYGKTLNLSENHLWSFYEVGSMSRALKAASAHAIGPEADWPYTDARPKSGIADDAATKLARYEYLSGWDAAKRAIANGNPVVVALNAKGWGSKSVKADGMVNKTSPTPLGANHVVLIVGYDEARFTIKNSWGQKWGDKGYGHVPYAYCQTSSKCYLAAIEAVDIDATKSK